ncbi:RNA recognition motif domain-containing protein [Phaeocystidibacter luteus]|uniref:RNA-binding protein n=1 Tax=Phaeocystidibacter luteus TaxID=911197 RepID=A0A6N6RLR8_9FLAO|nr:RNA-binding protein [Phaeocystidibacter luteus]KAB2814534.1 RNA-binding protein [Phaeocystidibacter luteus]
MNIFIGNLSYGVEDGDLADLFAQYGDVESARVIKDRETGRSRGFAFVVMNDDTDANSAIEALNGFDLNGRPLRVNQAIEKERRERRPRY